MEGMFRQIIIDGVEYREVGKDQGYLEGVVVIDGVHYSPFNAESQQEEDGLIMTDVMGQRAVMHYLCSQCWGDLRIEYIPGKERICKIRCWRCGEDTKGIVTKKFVEYKRSVSEDEAMEVRGVLEDLGIIDAERSGKSPDELLEDLGY